MPASSFYTSHLLPARSAREVVGGLTPVDIKHSSHKTLSAFLKACERDGLLVLKQGKGDVLVASVASAHTDVVSHRYSTRPPVARFGT
jgi:translation initiation factor 2D